MHNLLGVTLLRRDRIAEAIAHFERAVQLAPHTAGHHMNLGYALVREGRPGEALKALEEARRLAPALVQVRFYLGLALRASGDAKQAEQVFRELVESVPDFEEARHELNKLIYEAGRVEEAQAILRQSPTPLTPGKRLRLILTRVPPIAASSEQIAELRGQLEADLDALAAESPRLADPRGEVDATTFYLSYHGLPNRRIHEKLARLYAAAHPELTWTAPHCESWRPRSGRIRVGILSRFLYEHSIGRTTRGLVAKLDRKRFDLTAIFFPPVSQDQFARGIAADAEHVLVLPTSLAAARAAIAALRLDILFYQDIGMDPFTYFLAFARLAPVQCVSFGHPDTSGIPNVDWFISAERFEAAGAEQHYSERLWRMPDVGSLAYYYHPARSFAPASREGLGLPAGARIYTCPQALQKLHPDFDKLVAEILRRDGNARVALIRLGHPQWADILMRRLGRNMPDVAERVLLLPPMKHERFLGLLSVSDVVLDTPHFNGMNSTLETFAVGTPVVTMPGPLQRMRHTAGMYAAMGIEGLCASSSSQYADIALAVAADQEKRTAYSQVIREREHALFEDLRVVHGYEKFFEMILQRSNS